MPQTQTMTIDEKLDTLIKGIELRKQGKIEEGFKVGKQVPLAPYLAKNIKDHLGLEALLAGGWNLSEAEEEYGPGFLHK
jgi:hypothetical protein